MDTVRLPVDLASWMRRVARHVEAITFGIPCSMSMVAELMALTVGVRARRRRRAGGGWLEFPKMEVARVEAMVRVRLQESAFGVVWEARMELWVGDVWSVPWLLMVFRELLDPGGRMEDFSAVLNLGNRSDPSRWLSRDQFVAWHTATPRGRRSEKFLREKLKIRRPTVELIDLIE